MDVKKQLRFLADYLEMTREAGHTTAMLRGFDPALAERLAEEPLEDRPISVLCYDMRSANALRIADRNTVTLNSLDRLRGRTGPLLFDNGALWDLFARAAEKIEQLEKALDESQSLLCKLPKSRSITNTSS